MSCFQGIWREHNEFHSYFAIFIMNKQTPQAHSSKQGFFFFLITKIYLLIFSPKKKKKKKKFYIRRVPLQKGY